MNTFLHLFYFALYSGVLCLGYKILNIVMPILNNNYNNINPPHKKLYVCSNILKTSFFVLYTTDALYLLYSICILGTWDVERVKYLGLLYTGLDTVSLFMVPKMQFNTKIHHFSVIFLHSYCLYYNYEVGEMLKTIIVYAIWSANAYCVNLYLALRVFISEKNRYLHYLCCAALFTYVGCCIMNWSYQTYTIGGMIHRGVFPIGGYIYLLALLFIIYDDIVLMKYLYRRITGYYFNRSLSAKNLQKMRNDSINKNVVNLNRNNYSMLENKGVTQRSKYNTTVYDFLNTPRRM